MNWYKIFYWITVADSVTQLLGIIAIISAIIAGVSLVGVFFTSNSLSAEARGGEEKDQTHDYAEWKVWWLAWRKLLTVFAIIALITSLLWAFLPSRKDAMIIIAGGAVGNFITSDSSARQIPGEFMTLIREEMKSEIQNLKNGNVDTLKAKTREELEAIIRDKK